jgi:hypothetical protein
LFIVGLALGTRKTGQGFGSDTNSLTLSNQSDGFSNTDCITDNFMADYYWIDCWSLGQREGQGDIPTLTAQCGGHFHRP